MVHTEQHIARLIFKYYKGGLNASETLQLENWLSASRRNRDFFYSLEEGSTVFNILGENERDEKTNVQQLIFEKICSKINKNELKPVVPFSGDRIRSYRHLWKYAAAIAVLITGLIAFWFMALPADKQADHTLSEEPSVVTHDIMPGSDKAVLTLSDGQTISLDPNSAQIINENGSEIRNSNGELHYTKSGVSVINKIATQKGGQFKIVLSDGTRVWLNAASSIIYPTFFNSKVREVTVSGEVYFEVAKNKKMPFIVKVPGGAKIEVLGTSFNVNVYDDEASQVTTLVEGSIRMTNGNEKALVAPGQQAMLMKDLSAGTKTFRVTDANMEQALAWRTNFFVFNKADLQTVMRQLSRWYDLDIIYNKNIPQRSFQGKIPRDIALSQVLNALAKMEVNFEIKNKTLIVSP